MLWQEWWIWIVAGIGLAVLEMIVPGYIFLGFAIGAVVTGLLVATGLAGSSLQIMLLIAAVISLASWFVLRRVFGLRGAKPKHFDHDINDN